ncbi:MAG: hypothetical protein JSS22_08095, partial [Proteobacteria bacterium]|nr:hypothetical protein [Pseudomonadota bacterium]
RLDAFQWQTALAALPSDQSPVVEAEHPGHAGSDPPRVEALPAAIVEPVHTAAQDNAPPATVVESPPTETAAAPVEAAPAPPLFRPRTDLGKDIAPSAPTVIPIVRPPDDPGVDDSLENDEFTEQIASGARQADGWRGFLSRWGG